MSDEALYMNETVYSRKDVRSIINFTITLSFVSFNVQIL